jgi:hypothetical protein
MLGSDLVVAAVVEHTPEPQERVVVEVMALSLSLVGSQITNYIIFTL